MPDLRTEIELPPMPRPAALPDDIALLSRIADQLGIIAGVSLMDIGGAARITNTAASIEVEIPEFARVMICNAEGGDVRLDINQHADAYSTLRVIQDSWFTHPIRDTQHLYSYGAAGTFTNIRFIGFGGKL
jgi:hypothetical protein